jgi:hypothetical protein
VFKTFKLAEQKGNYTPKSTKEEYGSTDVEVKNEWS